MTLSLHQNRPQTLVLPLPSYSPVCHQHFFFQIYLPQTYNIYKNCVHQIYFHLIFPGKNAAHRVADIGGTKGHEWRNRHRVRQSKRRATTQTNTSNPSHKRTQKSLSQKRTGLGWCCKLTQVSNRIVRRKTRQIKKKWSNQSNHKHTGCKIDNWIVEAAHGGTRRFLRQNWGLLSSQPLSPTHIRMGPKCHLRVSSNLQWHQTAHAASFHQFFQSQKKIHEMGHPPKLNESELGRNKDGLTALLPQLCQCGACVEPLWFQQNHKLRKHSWNCGLFSSAKRASREKSHHMFYVIHEMALQLLFLICACHPWLKCEVQ